MARASQASGLREKVLDTAEALFASRGFGGVGLREVARLSGCSKSALFHHFPTKLDLYGAVVARILAALDETIASDLARSEDEVGSLARLLALVDALVDALAESPTRAPLLLRSVFETEIAEQRESTPEADRLLEKILRDIAALLSEGIEAGELRPVHVPHTIDSLIGMLVFHFASGAFGDDLLGRPVYSASEIRRHKDHLNAFIRGGLGAGNDPDPPASSE